MLTCTMLVSRLHQKLLSALSAHQARLLTETGLDVPVAHLVLSAIPRVVEVLLAALARLGPIIHPLAKRLVFLVKREHTILLQAARRPYLAYHAKRERTIPSLAAPRLHHALYVQRERTVYFLTALLCRLVLRVQQGLTIRWLAVPRCHLASPVQLGRIIPFPVGRSAHYVTPDHTSHFWEASRLHLAPHAPKALTIPFLAAPRLHPVHLVLLVPTVLLPVLLLA